MTPEQQARKKIDELLTNLSDLDQKLVEELTDSSAASIADPMFQLFQMKRQ